MFMGRTRLLPESFPLRAEAARASPTAIADIINLISVNCNLKSYIVDFRSRSGRRPRAPRKGGDGDIGDRRFPFTPVPLE
jgi:hypothetical protein